MDRYFWRMNGEPCGYSDGEAFWDTQGVFRGRFRGDELFGADGRYLGEVRAEDRLVRNPSRAGKSIGVAGVRGNRGSRVRGHRGARAIPAGYEDLPVFD